MICIILLLKFWLRSGQNEISDESFEAFYAKLKERRNEEKPFSAMQKKLKVENCN